MEHNQQQDYFFLQTKTTPFIDAILRKDDAEALKLLQSGVNPNEASTCGFSFYPIHGIVYFDLINTLRALLLHPRLEKDQRDVRGATALHYAGQRNDVKAAEFLLTTGKVSFDAVCSKGQTVLHTCASANASKVAEKILCHIEERDIILLEKRDSAGNTALHIAAFYDAVSVIRIFVQAALKRSTEIEYFLNARDNFGRTALHWACAGGSVKALKVFLDLDIDLTAVDVSGRGAVHYAAMSQMNAVQLLTHLRRMGLDPNSVDNQGFTPVFYATQQQEKLDVVRFLEEWGADFSRTCKDGWTIAHSSACYAHQDALMEYMIQSHLDVIRIRDSNGYTPLHFAASWGRINRVHLLSAVLDLSIRSNRGATPLHCAALIGQQQIVKFIVEFTKNPNEKMDNGITVLHVSVSRGSPDVVNFLLNKGADPEALDDHGRTPLMFVASAMKDEHETSDNSPFGIRTDDQHELVINALLKAKCNVKAADDVGWTALHYAAASGRQIIVQRLIDAGADVSAVDYAGRTPLHYAVQLSNASVANVILGLLLAVDKQSLLIRDNDGFYPLHWASLNGTARTVVTLLGIMGCYYNLPSSEAPYEVTPLHLMAYRGRHNVIQSTLSACKDARNAVSNGASTGTSAIIRILTAKDARGHIPLHYAVKYGHLRCTEALLVKQHVDLLARWADNDGLTPFHIAAANGSWKCLNLLKQYSQRTVTRSDKWGRTPEMLALTAYAPCNYSLPKEPSSSWGSVRDKNGRGCLHRAAFSGQDPYAFIGPLAKTWNDGDKNGVTALHIACAVGNLPAAEMLASLPYPNLATTDKRGMTPGDWASAMGKIDIVEFILDSRGARDEREAALQQKCTKYFSAASLILAAEKGEFEVVDILIQFYPFLVYLIDFDGATALHRAAASGNAECVQRLLDADSLTDLTDLSGRTPVEYAAISPHCEECLDLLLKKSFVGLIDRAGNSLLHLAALHGNEKGVMVILDNMTKEEAREIANMSNDNGETLLHITIRQGMTKATEYILPLSVDSYLAQDSFGRYPFFSVFAEDQPKVLACAKDAIAFLLANVDELNASNSSELSSTLSKTRRSSAGSTAQRDAEADESLHATTTIPANDSDCY